MALLAVPGCCGAYGTAGSAAVDGVGTGTLWGSGPGSAIIYLYLVYIEFQL